MVYNKGNKHEVDIRERKKEFEYSLLLDLDLLELLSCWCSGGF